MYPLYFGDSQRPLFGIYHPPGAQLAREVGVLLCYPAVQEYMSTHWAFRRLSKLLSQAGLHVFRFDYFGTGDSAGEAWEGSVAQWKTDIRYAADELKDISGAKELSIVGLRLGAALAAEISSEGLHIENLVLWDPVVIGKEYLRELKRLHDDLTPLFHDNHKEEEFNELLGYPFTSEMRAGIEQINLLSVRLSGVKKTFLIVSDDKGEYGKLRNQLAAENSPFEYRLVQDSGDWEKPEDFDQALLVNDILHEIRAVLVGNPE